MSICACRGTGYLRTYDRAEEWWIDEPCQFCEQGRDKRPRPVRDDNGATGDESPRQGAPA